MVPFSRRCSLTNRVVFLCIVYFTSFWFVQFRQKVKPVSLFFTFIILSLTNLYDQTHVWMDCVLPEKKKKLDLQLNN